MVRGCYPFVLIISSQAQMEPRSRLGRLNEMYNGFDGPARSFLFVLGWPSPLRETERWSSRIGACYNFFHRKPNLFCGPGSRQTNRPVRKISSSAMTPFLQLISL